MDEAYLGAPKSGKKRGRGTEREKMAVAVSKDTKNRPMFLRLKIIPNITTQTLQTRDLVCAFKKALPLSAMATGVIQD